MMPSVLFLDRVGFEDSTLIVDYFVFVHTLQHLTPTHSTHHHWHLTADAPTTSTCHTPHSALFVVCLDKYMNTCPLPSRSSFQSWLVTHSFWCWTTLLAALGGNETPNAKDIKKILEDHGPAGPWSKTCSKCSVQACKELEVKSKLLQLLSQAEVAFNWKLKSKRLKGN